MEPNAWWTQVLALACWLIPCAACFILHGRIAEKNFKADMASVQNTILSAIPALNILWMFILLEDYGHECKH